MHVLKTVAMAAAMSLFSIVAQAQEAVHKLAIHVDENDPAWTRIGEVLLSVLATTGEIDEALPPCPAGLPRTDPYAYASAVDACHWTTRAGWNESLGFLCVEAASCGPDSLCLRPGEEGVLSLRAGLAG